MFLPVSGCPPVSTAGRVVISRQAACVAHYETQRHIQLLTVFPKGVKMGRKDERIDLKEREMQR